MLRPMEVYQQIGLLAGPDQFPVVASFSTIAGPSDSTYVLFGLSLPNSALMFQREGDAGFVGRYAVSLRFKRDSVVVHELKGREEVRVPSFAETGRTDESVVYQTIVALEPGRYVVELEASDASVPKGFKATDTLTVPAYHAEGRRLSAPVFVYRAEGRESGSASPDLIVNPRHTIPFGGEAPRVYLEGYGVDADQPIEIRVIGTDDKEIWRTETRLGSGNDDLRHTLVEIPTDDLPVGRVWVEAALAGDTGPAVRAPLIVTLSDQWMVANFDEMLEFLRYIATSAELDSLRNSSGAERAALWERFWERRDPIPSTPINEYREQFFERVRLASLYFPEPGLPGWKTDRGEVYIVLGPPDHVFENSNYNRHTGRPIAYEWVYETGPSGRLVLAFVDRNGFERYELTPASKATYRSAATRARRPARR